MRVRRAERRTAAAPGPDLAAGDRLLRQVARRSPHWPAVLALAVLASTAATLALPAALAGAVDAVLAGRGDSACVPCFTTLAALVGSEALTQLADPHTAAAATALLRTDFLRHSVAGGGDPDRPAPGDLVARLTGNTAEAGTAAASVIYSAAQVALSLGAVIALGVLYPPLALTFLATGPVSFLLVRRYLRRTTRLAVGYQEGQAAVAARLLDALAGIRTIAASGTVEREIERVLRPVPELSRRGRELWHSQRRIAWQTSLLAPATQIPVLAVAGYAVGTGALSAGGLLAALGYSAAGLGFFGTAQSLLALARARAGAARLAAVLDRPAPPPGTRPLPPGGGRLELRGVRVERGGATVLDGVELTVAAGSCVAVVGRSGAGKSLLAALAGRLAEPQAGTVLLDGVPVDQIEPGQLRAAVAYAFADPALYGETIEDALALGTVSTPGESTRAAVPAARSETVDEGDGADGADRTGGADMTDPSHAGEQREPTERVRQAAEAVAADAFIRRLPAGYRTPLAQAPLSGGERQRLGLARALAHGGRLIVLDDATSSLDTITEAVVVRAFDQALAGHTRLVVTHRAAVADRADAVAWLDGGRIRALAPHRHLWQDPDYRAVFPAAQE